MRVLLVNPTSPFLIEPMVFPPLGLWFVGAAVKEAGHEVDYTDLNVCNTLPLDYDAYLVTGTTPQLRSMLDVVRQVGPGRITVAGGPHAAIAPSDLITGGYRWVVRGEGEEAILRILDGKEPGGVLDAPRIKDLSTVPHPIRRWAEHYVYYIDGRRATHMMTSRGCPWRCAFCCHALWEGLTTWMPLDWVQKEIAIVAKQGYRAVMFYDDTFTVVASRVQAIGEMLQKRDMLWRCFVRADTVTHELATMMHELGCVEVGMGVESGSNKILANINKRETAEQMAAAVAILKGAGIRVKAFLIAGLPGENEETIQDTKDWIKKARPDDFDIALFVPYPGSPIHKNRAEYDIQWDSAASDEMWYKGKPGKYSSKVFTRALSRERLAELREEIEGLKAASSVGV